MKGNGRIIGPKIIFNSASASGVHDLFDNYILEKDGNWPVVAPSVRIVESTTTINEGSQITFDIYSTGIDSGSTLNYNLVALSGTIADTDFDQPISGSFNVNSDYLNTLTFTANNDTFDEGLESFQMEVSDSEGSILGSSVTININDTSTGGGAEPSGIGSDIANINNEISSFTESTNVSTVVSAIENLGYTVIAVPTYGAVAESMSGVNSTINTAGRFRFDIFDEVNELEVSNGFTNNTLNGFPYICMAGFDNNQFYGTIAMMYSDYGTGTQLKNLWSPNQFRTLYAYVLNANGTNKEYTSTASSTIFSDNQQPNSNGYNTTTRFSVDDGTWGFRNASALDGNGGPYLSQVSTDRYGCENPNGSDTSANDFYWDDIVNVSTTYKFYVFIKKV